MEADHRDLAPEELGRELLRMWEDQAAFNLQIRPVPTSLEQMAAQAKDMVVYTESELHELLRQFEWKAHRRRTDVRDNPAHRKEECIDAFKCLVSLMQICGMTLRDVVEGYWAKTAVVRQKYQAEWVHRLDRPCAIVDIDNVICDYVTGLGDWMLSNARELGIDLDRTHVLRLVSRGQYLNAHALQIPIDEWQTIKHVFRTTGGKRRLPVMPGAFEFLFGLQERGMQIILLTSRPIDRYPNIYTDTLHWLTKHQLPFDFIWWANDKVERLAHEGLDTKLIKLIVDDDLKFIHQYTLAQLPCYWLNTSGAVRAGVSDCYEVSSLPDVLKRYDELQEANHVYRREA